MARIDQKRKECVENNIGNRKLVIYGAGNNLTHTLRILNNPEEYILCDKRYEEIKVYEGTVIHNPERLRGQREKYYVLVSVYKEYQEIRELLESFGYQKEKDYCYLSIDIEPATDVKPENYSDMYGNKIIGSLNGAVVRFFGRDSIVNVQEGFRGEGLVIDVYSDVILDIGSSVFAARRMQWKFMDGTECHIGNSCSWYSDRGELVLSGEGAKCNIGNAVRFGERNVLWVSPETSLVIGNDVLFSKLITIRTNDGHPIYDLATGECINYYTGKERSVIIHDHVWIGEGVMILYNTEIGSGSIVGAKSLVKGKFPNNCILAGHMAKVIRENVAWSHKRLAGGLEELDEEWRQMTMKV